MRYALHVVCSVVVEKIIRWCDARVRYDMMGLLFLVAYIFLLRLPSEALPMQVGRAGGQSSLYIEDGMLVLELRRRCARTHARPARLFLSVEVCPKEEPAQR
jgi:hypothetical protein